VPACSPLKTGKEFPKNVLIMVSLVICAPNSIVLKASSRGRELREVLVISCIVVILFYNA